MVAAFLVLTQSIERWPSMSSSQTNGSSDNCGAADCCGGGDCCAAIVTRVREGITSRERRPTAARYLRFVMLAPGDTVPDGCPKLRPRVSVMQAVEDLSLKGGTHALSSTPATGHRSGGRQRFAARTRTRCQRERSGGPVRSEERRVGKEWRVGGRASSWR